MKQETVKTTIRLPPKLKRKLERLARNRGISQSKYVCGLIAGKSSEALPPKQFWDVMQQLYDIHEMLLRAANLSPQFTEAARRLERSIVELQEAYTLDEEVP